MELHNERELLILISQGDEEAFREVFLCYRPRIYTAALRMTGDVNKANDIYQDVFLKVWLKRSTLAEVDNFSGWLFIIARNLILDAFKEEENILISVLHANNGGLSDSAYTPADILQNKEIRELLSAAIGNLPERQRETYRLIKEEGMSRSEAAEKMNVSPETIKWNLERAMRSVRAYCSKYLLLVPFSVLVTWLCKIFL